MKRRRTRLQAGTVRPLSSPVSVGSAFIYLVNPRTTTLETHRLLLAYLTSTTDGGLEHSNRENPQWEILQTSRLYSSESLHAATYHHYSPGGQPIFAMWFGIIPKCSSNSSAHSPSDA